MKIDRALLKRFKNNECSEEETRSVYEWLSDPGSSEEVAVILEEMWDETDCEEPAVPVDFDWLFRNVLGRTARGNSSPREEEMSSVHSPDMQSLDEFSNVKSRSFMLYRIAAGLVSTLVVAGLVYKLFLEDKYFIYSTTYAETKGITLPDGSDVTLNSNSTIRYKYNYDESSESNDAPREAFLDGEAFFNVREKVSSGAPGVKFIVHANQVDVEVLGTSFNVNTRRGRTLIVLNSGMVRLAIGESGSRIKQMLMSPGELVEIAGTNKHFDKKTVDVESYSSWIDNKLIFDNAPVSDILSLIEDNFGYEVVLRNTALENRLYTDTTPANDLDLLLSKLSIVYDLKVTRADKQIVIEAKN